MIADTQLTIKDLPKDQRPREKLMLHGAASLSNAELIAILLRTGTKKETAVGLAERLLNKSGLIGLAMMQPQDLCKLKGIKTAKAVTVAAALELGKRLSTAGFHERPLIRCPQDAANLMMARLRYEQKEHFISLLLNMKNYVIASPVISVGSLNASIVHPRELFRQAISYSAAALIMVHNHPSGDPTPSQEDIEITQKISAAGELLEIKVIDHIIIGDGKYVSLKEKGII